jgi:hypothetical protein
MSKKELFLPLPSNRRIINDYEMVGVPTDKCLLKI